MKPVWVTASAWVRDPNLRIDLFTPFPGEEPLIHIRAGAEAAVLFGRGTWKNLVKGVLNAVREYDPKMAEELAEEVLEDFLEAVPA